MTTFFGDTETFCETPLAHGLHRYAEKVEITVFQWAIDDGPVEVIDCTAPGWEAKVKVALAAADAADEQVWQNSAFDRTVLRHAWGYEIPVEKLVDTMVQALAHSLPGSLATLCDILGVPTDSAKDKAGKALIQLFCKPRPKNQKIRRATRRTHPVEWQRFLDYAGSDIEAMREVRKRLPKWNYPGNARERELWILDQKINDRGVAVDLALAEAAVRATDLAKKGLKAETQRLTGFDPETGQGLESTTKRDAFLKFLLGEFGVELPNMQKATLERRLADENLPEPVKELLRIRLMATVTSTTKYKALMRSTSSDGRLRGTLQFCGAARTGRWAGRLFQPQNLPRVAKHLKNEIEPGIAAFKADCADLLYSNVMEVASACIRGALVAEPGNKLVSADLSNIEGRFLAWLAGEQWKLDAFANGDDLYVLGYSRSFNVPVEKVVADEEAGGTMRLIGKVQELALGFQGAVGAFTSMAALYGVNLPEKRVLEIVKGWRKANPAIVNFWYEMERCAIRAAEQPGLRVSCGRIIFQRDGSWLRMRLPSGRVLCYPGVAVEDGKLSYMGTNQYTRKFERIATYGGKLCLAEGTRVLTPRGWIAIEQVLKTDLVWDGVEWVRHEGLARNGVMGVIKAHGVWMTPDHEVLTVKGWKRASQSERFDRAACRLPDDSPLCGERRQEVSLDGALRLRPGGDDARHGTSKTEEPGHHSFVRVQAQRDDRASPYQARNVEASGLRGVALDERQVPLADAPGLAKLRRARDHGLRAVADFVRELLGGHGPDLCARVDDREEGQQPGLQPRELQVGDVYGAGEQPPAARGMVFDLINAGPRRRFTVADEGGQPLIVHNCENATQAGARDVLAHNMPAVEAAGYRLVLGVHDELVAETLDDKVFSSDWLCAKMSTVPPWATGLPLAASGWEGQRYRK